MALPLINLGTGTETGDGDQLRIAFGKVNAYLADHETRISANTVSLTGLGGAATMNVGTTTGTVADGGALTAEIARAQAAEALLAPRASPTFTGTPTAPTPPGGDNSTKLATTAYVQLAVAGGGVAAVIYSGSQALTATQQANARGNIAAAASGANTDITSLAAPALGAATASTATFGTATAQVATTAFVANSYAPLASPVFTGVPLAPTPTAGTNTTQIATTAFVASSYAPLASPTFTGVPAAPTPTAGTNTTQIATTAFVTSAVATGDTSATLTYTPTLTVQSGTLTTATATGRYRRIGQKLIWVQIDVSITNNGTAAGFISATLPVSSAASPAILAGREPNATGKLLQGSIQSGSSAATIVNYDNSYPGGSGYRLILSGIYEVP